MTRATTMNKADEATAQLTRADAEALLIQEAHCLDAKLWNDWLALYEEDAVYWVPSWQDMQTPTTNPATQLSLIYYAQRTRLEERVWRLGSGLSAASVPLSRTLHNITNIRSDKTEPCVIESNFVVHVFEPRRREVHINFGTYRHQLRCGSGGWRITSKKILLMNDYLPAFIDIYTI